MTSNKLRMSVYCTSKIPAVCKEWPGLPSTGGVGIERGSTRFLDENATTAHVQENFHSVTLQAALLKLKM